MGPLPPVPSAKVSPPRVQALGRERLNNLVEQIWQRRLGVVVAPAGSGKTTLLAHYAAGAEVPVAWYRAEDSDYSTESLLRHLERSVKAVFEDLSGDWTTVESAAASLESWSGQRALMIVDDFHSLEGTEAEVALERLIEYLPPTIRIMIATRRPPRFNLSRLRVSGDLLEITSDDLRFRSWEVEQLFRNFYEQPMPPQDLAALARRTEGWAAGLQLFHLATQRKPANERRDTLNALGYGAKPVREYLARNALEELGEELKEFLLQTSLLVRLSGRICDEFLGRTGSGAVLEELERRQIFTQAIDDLGNFRYHEILRSHLEDALLEQIGKEEAHRRFKRAAVLLEKAGAIPEALRAYARAEDWEASARLLGREGEHLAEDPGEWIHSLPLTVLDNDPWLLLTKARRYFASGRLHEARDTYLRAEAAFGPVAARNACVTERRAVSIWLSDEQALASDWVSLARSATQRDPAGVSRKAAALTGETGKFVAAMALVLAGQVGQGREALEEVSSTDANPLLGVVARFVAAISARMAGRVGRIDEFEKAAEEAEAAKIPWLTRIARASTALGGRREGIAEARAIREACKRAGDDWGAALTALIEGIARLWSGNEAFDVLEESAQSFADLGASVLESWARSLQALSAAQHCCTGNPEEIALEAESLARTTGVPGARALALIALGLLGGDRSQENLALGVSLSDECGLRPGLEVAVGSTTQDALGLTVRCFGVFSIELEGKPIDLSRVKPRAREVLKILAMNAGRPVHREVLIEAAWGDADADSATKGLHVALSSLRQLLEPGNGRRETKFIVREDGAYRLAISEQDSDVATFNAALAEGRAAHAGGDLPRATSELTRALDSYAGELLPEVGPAEWAVEQRELYVAAAAEAAHLLAITLLESGRSREAASVAARGLQIDRYRDALWRVQIEALETSGDKAAAARARTSYEAALAELGVATTS